MIQRPICSEKADMERCGNEEDWKSQPKFTCSVADSTFLGISQAHFRKENGYCEMNRSHDSSKTNIKVLP